MRRSLALVIALVVAVGLAGCGGDDDGDGGGSAGGGYGGAAANTEDATTTEQTTERPPVATVVVRDGEPVGGVQELEFGAGDTVRFKVRSDVADEIHVHGYDLSEGVTAGGSASFAFPADIEGIFEVELEERGTPIAELRVVP